MAKNLVQFGLSVFVVIYVFQESVMVEGTKISHTTALRKATTDLPTVRRQHVQFRRASCNCSGTACECAVRVNLAQINFNQLASIRIYYNPADVSLNLDVLLNGRVIYHTGLSARNPPPFCMPVPQLPVVMLCVRLYDISLGNNSIKACVNFEVQLVNNPILVVSFDCIRVGANGVGIEKPSPSALVDSPDPVISADDTDVLAYTGSDMPDSSSDATAFSETDNYIINKSTLPATASLSDETNDINESTTESLTPVTTIASIDIVTLLTTKMSQEPVSLNPGTTSLQNTTYKTNVSTETDTEENITPCVTQASNNTTMSSEFSDSGNGDVSEINDLSNYYITTQENPAHTTETPSEAQPYLHLEQNDKLQSPVPVTDTYITATEDFTHTAEISSDIDIVIHKIKTLTTLSDRLTTTSPLNIHIGSNPSDKYKIVETYH